MGSVRVSEKFGVNPSVGRCFVCNSSDGKEVMLIGKISRRRACEMYGDEVGKGLEGTDDDVQAPSSFIYNREPCDACKDLMEQGIILISADESKTADRNNPWRSGGWVVVKERALREALKPGEFLDTVLRTRVAFLPDEVWDKLGLPRSSKETPRAEKEPQGSPDAQS